MLPFSETCLWLEMENSLCRRVQREVQHQALVAEEPALNNVALKVIRTNLNFAVRNLTPDVLLNQYSGFFWAARNLIFP